MLLSHRYKQTLEINETKLFEMKTYTNEGDGTCLFIQTNDTIINIAKDVNIHAKRTRRLNSDAAWNLYTLQDTL